MITRTYVGLAPFKCPRCGCETWRFIAKGKARRCVRCGMVVITAPPGKITLYKKE